MNKFKFMSLKEIDEYTTSLEIELRTCDSRRLTEIDQEITAANQAVLAGEYVKTRDVDYRSQRDQRITNVPGQGRLNVLGTYQMGQGAHNDFGAAERMSGDVYSTVEYRNAFMQYVLKGVKSEVLEHRTAGTTQTGDIGTVIPSTILDKIYEKATAFSMIFDRITKTNVKCGVNVPISSLKPVATWVTEGNVSDKQKKTTGSVIFTYHKLQCRVAVSLEASTVSLSLFENTIAENIYEAMIVAVETAVVAGTGNGQPLGITKDTSIPADQVITISKNGDLAAYDTWTGVVSNIPLAYESKVVITMTKKDWDKYVSGMMDANGQPIARVNYGIAERPERRFMGYEVVLVEGYLASFDLASTGDVFAFICDYRDYLLNSNLEYLFKRYFDEDTDEWISKATLIADGKLAAPHSVILLKKGA